ncbi:hypothetical protein ACO1O0_005263 [Amphichorda felina]
MIPCELCGLSLWCCAPHKAEDFNNHSFFCMNKIMLDDIIEDTKDKLDGYVGDQFDLYNWDLMAQVASTHDNPTELLELHETWVNTVSSKANLLASWETRKATEVSLDMFLSLRGCPYISRRMVERTIPNLQLRLGKLECLETLIDGIEQQAGIHLVTLDIFLRPLEPHPDIGFQFLIIILKILALQSLRDMDNPNRPLDLPSIGHSGLVDLENHILFLIGHLHSVNPFFWSGFFDPSVFVLFPIDSYDKDTPDPRLGYLCLGHMCLEDCASRPKHVAQLAYLDVFLAVTLLDGTWEAMRTFIRRVVSEEEIDQRYGELRGTITQELPSGCIQMWWNDNVMGSAP